MGLLRIECVALVYCLLTSLIIGALWTHLPLPTEQLEMRGLWLLATALTVLIALKWHNPLTCLIRTALQLAWLSIWYPDVYEFNRILPNLDHLFAQTEQTLFGCQPALWLHEWLPGPIWSEAFNLGYWSYFPMILVLSISIFFKEMRAQQLRLVVFKQTTTLVLCSFFLYYAIYMFLPVAGPQFYFCAVGTSEIAAGHFPALGSYFSQPAEMLPAPGWSDGVFYHLVSNAQSAGERPVAAFPSSHVGISTIIMILAFRRVRYVAWCLLPFWILLVGATVYIQAHYAIDALAGLVSAPIILFLAYFFTNARRTNQA